MYFICTIIMFYLNVLLGVLNHCTSDRAIQVPISRTICIIIIIMSSAWYDCIDDDRPWPRLMSNKFCLISGIYRLLANISF